MESILWLKQSGQSPLHYWADIPAKKHSKLFALPVTTIHGEPGVKFRGLFINDEAPALTGWWARRANNTDYTFDTEFYAHVFDLIVRLKGNFLWPAMWGSSIPRPGRVFFTDDAGNQQLADDYGVVVGTSHHEPMQRASNEWNETIHGKYDWASNKEGVYAWMEEGARRAGQNESYFTLGMRGLSDEPISGDDPIGSLRDILSSQREILAKYHGNESAALQLWTVYKEVQAYYEAGMVPADDVTLMFADDNWGNIRRLPTDEENKRSGGIGMYYHLDYVGRPKSWKWQNCNNLPKVYKELYQAYERGAKQLWVMNVGDIKPVEVPFAFSMDLAWNADKFDFNTIPTYLEELAARDFGPEYAKEIASILFEHSHLIGFRKFESVDPWTYSVQHYHEAERIKARWNALAERAKAIAKQLPKEYYDAWFHLGYYPVVAGANYYTIQVNRGLNQQAGMERRNSANSLAQRILDDLEYDFDLVAEYDALGGGKWAGIMSTPKFDMASSNWRPSSRDVISNISFVLLRQNFDYGFGNLGMFGEASDSAMQQGRIAGSINPSLPTSEEFDLILPPLSPYGPKFRTVDIFHRGDQRKDIPWTISAFDYDWIKVSQTSGLVSATQPEVHINISVDWDAVPEGFWDIVKVRIDWEPAPYWDYIHIPVHNERVPGDFKGFAEVDRYISIEAPHYQRASEGRISYKQMNGLATRSESGSIALRPFHGARKDTEAAKEAWVEYDFFLFGTGAKVTNATFYINGALDTDPNMPMKYSVAVDGAEPLFLRLLNEPKEPGDLPLDWTASVASHVWLRNVTFGALEPGKHTLRWQTNSPEVYLEKIVLWANFTGLPSYLGPPESTLLG